MKVRDDECEACVVKLVECGCVLGALDTASSPHDGRQQ